MNKIVFLNFGLMATTLKFRFITSTTKYIHNDIKEKLKIRPNYDHLPNLINMFYLFTLK